MKKIVHFLISITLLTFPVVILAQAPNLGTAGSFALFTGTGAFTSADAATSVTGNVGTNVGAFIGFPPGTLNGQKHVADAVSATAATDVCAAYNDLRTRTAGTIRGPSLGGLTLTPGTTTVLSAATINGTLTLDGQNNPNSIFIIQIDGALSLAASSQVVLINGASSCNVFFQVNGLVDIGTNSVFRGNILTNGAINLLSGATLLGRGLACTGAITLTTNNTVNNACVTSNVTLPLTVNATAGPVVGGVATVTATATGGTGPFQFSIDGGVTFQNSGVFPGIAAGSTVTITARDANGVIATSAPVTIAAAIVPLTVTAAAGPVVGGVATVTATAAGGTGPIQFSIDGGVTFQNSGVFPGIAAGSTVTITARDANGVIATSAPVTIAAAIVPLTVTAAAGPVVGGVATVTATAAGGTVLSSSVLMVELLFKTQWCSQVLQPDQP
jgi:hypothetical protein